MNDYLKTKDSLYYEDLIYAIKKIGNFEQAESKTTEERIALRLQPIYSEEEQKENELMGEELSDFELDIFLIVRSIVKKANDSFKSLGNISKYPELIKEEIQELEHKKSELSMLPVTTNPLTNNFKSNQVIHEEQTDGNHTNFNGNNASSYTMEDFSEDCKVIGKAREKLPW